MGLVFLNADRNKRSRVLDLKQPEGLAVLQRLLVDADVLAYNVRPQAVGGILASLLARERSGRGDRIDIPMFETMAAFVLGDHLGGQTFQPPLDARFARYASRIEHVDHVYGTLACIFEQRSTTDRRRRARPPRTGEHTRELLLQAGYSAAEVDTLCGSGMARQAEALAP